MKKAVVTFYWTILTIFILLLFHVPEPAGTFAAECAKPGVVKCVGFDSSAEIPQFSGYGYPHPQGIVAGSSTTPALDTTIFSSGTGSLHFSIPASAGPNAGGGFFLETHDFNPVWGANSNFYIQWRQRFDTAFITTAFSGNGQKQIIIGPGDTQTATYPGCADIEIVGQNTSFLEIPAWYNSCYGAGAPGGTSEFEEFRTSDLAATMRTNSGPYFQPNPSAVSPYCLRTNLSTGNTPTLGNCFPYYPNEWMTFKVHVTLGALTTDAGGNYWPGHFTEWIAREGQAGVIVYDLDWNFVAGNTAGQTNTKFGLVNLTPYTTSRTTTTFVASNTWYDDLIVSSNDISMTYTIPVSTKRRAQLTSQ